MNYEYSLRETGTSLFLVFLSLFVAGLVFSSAGSAGEISVPIPSETVEAGQTVTLPVILHDAENINGYEIVVSELSGGEISINTASEKVAGTRITGDNKKAVLLSTDTPLNGDVTLFSVDVTPVSGKNAIVSVEVVDIMNTDDESSTDNAVLAAKYPGADTVIPVTNGKTEYVKDSANNVQTTATSAPTSVVPTYTDRISTGSSQDSSQADLPSASTSTSSATSTKKSPGFLPLTVLLAGGIAAGCAALRRRS